MITDGRILAGMARAGFIKWEPNQTDRHWTGCTVPRLHVQEGPALKYWSDVFRYNGKNYRLRLLEGCSRPFVFLADETPKYQFA